MAVFQIESGTANGRGFTNVAENGYLGKFLSYIKRPAVDGSSQTFTATAGTDTITAGTHGYVDGDEVRLTTTGTLPAGLDLATSYYIIYVDANNFQLATNYANAIASTQIDITDAGTGTHSVYALGGGAGWYIHDDQSALATDPYIVVCDTASPSVNDYNTGPSGGAPKFIKIGLLTAEAGYVRAQGYLWWDSLAHTGYGLWFGLRIATYDDADFAYDFRGGDECMMVQSRIGSTWHTVLLDDFVGDTNLLEPATSVGVLQSGISAGSSVTLQLATGEAANFTVGKHYYLFDFDGHSWVDYVTVTARDTGADQITIDNVSQAYPSGAAISSYGHRYYAAGNGTAGSVINMNYTLKSKLPYVSGSSGYVLHNQSGYIRGGCGADAAGEYLKSMAPDDDGNYAVQRPGVYEYWMENISSNGTIGMNRGYGVTKNVYLCSTAGMTPALDGKIIGGNNWIYMQRKDQIFSSYDNAFAVLFLDTESTS